MINPNDEIWAKVNPLQMSFHICFYNFKRKIQKALLSYMSISIKKMIYVSIELDGGNKCFT